MLRSQVTPKSSVREDRVDASLQEAEVITVGAAVRKLGVCLAAAGRKLDVCLCLRSW